MNPANDTGIPIIGYAPLLDEAECLEGWIKNIRFFSDEVWALYDPRSIDNTLVLLQDAVEKYKDSDVPVYIWEQDIMLGDSYRGHEGPKKELSYRANVNKFMKDHIPMFAWSMWLAGDERLNPHEIDKYYEYLLYADYQGFDGICFDLYDCYPDMNHYANYRAIYKEGLFHRKLVKRYPHYKYNLTPHSNYIGGANFIQSGLQFFHFGHLKGDSKYLNWWRHKNGLDLLDRLHPEDRFLPFENPFKDWKKGELQCPIINNNTLAH